MVSGYDTEEIVADEWLPVFLELMKKGKEISITPRGYSMAPFLCGDRDSIIFQLPQIKIKRGDIVLYRRESGTYVAHRVHHYNKSGYFMIGDNHIIIEGPISEEQIYAVSSKIIRKGKTIDCNKNMVYKAIVQLWLIIRPLRKVIINIWLHMRK